MTTPSKRKGSGFERVLAQYFRDRGYVRVQRRYGAGAQKDTGDLSGIEGVVFEAKAVKRHELAVWMDETRTERDNAHGELGICIVKRAGKPVEQSYAICSLEEMVTLLANAGYK